MASIGTIKIKATPAEVYPYLMYEKRKTWTPTLIGFEFPNGEGVGLEFIIKVQEGKKIATYKGIILEAVANKKMVSLIYNDLFSTKVTNTLEDCGTYTLFTHSMELTPKNSGFKATLMLVLSKLLCKPMMSKFLKSLKNAVENKL